MSWENNDEEQTKKAPPLQSANISLARWPDGFSVSGYIDKERVAFARCRGAGGLDHAIALVASDVLHVLRKVAEKESKK